jgi:RNA polymerase sigma-70 factor (ECF subfamily)
VADSEHKALPTDDAELVSRVGDGDVPAYRELVRRHAPNLRRFAGRLLRDDTEAEDVVQETFLRLWQRAADYTPAARVGTWLHRIAHNLAVDRLRSRGRLTALDEDEEVGGAASARQPALLDEKRRVEALELAHASLPPRQGAAVTLVHLHGLSGTEAADVLGVGAEALESLLSRGRRSLKVALLEATKQDRERT